MIEEKVKLAEFAWEEADDINDRCQIQGCRQDGKWWAVHLIETDYGPVFPPMYLCDKHHEKIKAEQAVEKAKRRHRKKEVAA